MIPRVRCMACGATHAVIPAFLFAFVRYPTATLATYIEQAAEHSQTPKATWALDLADGPRGVETLYRWLRRLRQRLSALLPALKSELLKLEPAFDLSALEESVLKSHDPSSSRTKQTQSSAHLTSNLSSLSTVTLCALSYWLSEQVLQLAGELFEAETVLRQGSGQVLSPVAFLNYFCWKKLGVALISPSSKPRAP